MWGCRRPPGRHCRGTERGAPRAADGAARGENRRRPLPEPRRSPTGAADCPGVAARAGGGTRGALRAEQRATAVAARVISGKRVCQGGTSCGRRICALRAAMLFLLDDHKISAREGASRPAALLPSSRWQRHECTQPPRPRCGLPARSRRWAPISGGPVWDQRLGRLLLGGPFRRDVL